MNEIKTDLKGLFIKWLPITFKDTLDLYFLNKMFKTSSICWRVTRTYNRAHEYVFGDQSGWAGVMALSRWPLSLRSTSYALWCDQGGVVIGSVGVVLVIVASSLHLML